MKTVVDFLLGLVRFWPYVLAAIAIMILVIVVVVVLAIRASRKKAPSEPAADEPPPPKAEKPERPSRLAIRYPASLRKSFTEAGRALRAHITGRDYRYRVPWYLLLGESDSGKTTLLENTGLNLPLGKPPPEETTGKQDLNWWFFDKGVVLDLAGDYVLRAGGVTSDEPSWRAFLRLLQKHRPERPIDGVVLTVPVTDFLASGVPAEAIPGVIKEKASHLYDKLRQAQKALGVCFPIYVLVTKCDLITGFRTFCREVPEHLHQDIFGWSNPYALETSFSPEWVDEAMATVTDQLYQIQTELFAEKRELVDPDTLFLFPGEFQALSTPLGAFLNHVFRQSAYHEPLFLRGIYFCGAHEPEPRYPVFGKARPGAARLAAGPVPPATQGPLLSKEPTPSEEAAESEPAAPGKSREPSSAAGKPVFLKDLFESKIFSENALARPTYRTFLSRNRKVLACQILAVLILLVGGIGLWSGWNKLSTNKEAFYSVLKNISRDVSELRKLGGGRGDDSFAMFKLLQSQAKATIPFEELSLHLLRGMTGISRSHLTSAFIPSSWFSPIHDDIRRSMGVAYDEVILKGMFLGLAQKLRRILETPVGTLPPPVPGQEAVAIEETPEFRDLSSFVEELREFEKYSDLYNNLQQSEDLADLTQVVEYLFGIKLPPAFLTHAEYYHEALSAVDYRVFRPQAFNFKARIRVRKFAQVLYQRLFQYNPVLVNLQKLHEQLQSLERKSLGGGKGVQIFEDLLNTINWTEKYLAQPELAWVSRPTFDLGPSFDNLLDGIELSAFLGPELRNEVQKTGESSFITLSTEITNFQTPLVGPIVDRSGATSVTRLSPKVLQLKAAVEDLLALSFVTSAEMERLRPQLDPASRLTWDTKLLAEATRLHEPYDAFLEKSLGNFPVPLQSTVRDVALERLEASMIDIIARSQNFEPLPERFVGRSLEGDLRMEVQNFKASLNLLGQILSIFNRLGMSRSYSELSTLVLAQTTRLLKKVDDLLEQEAHYSADFTIWDGKTPAGLAAFNTQDSGELAYYLELQRERIRHLAYEYAAPLVEFSINRLIPPELKGAPMLISKWVKIIAELNKYDSRKPANSVATLEKFIRFELNQLNPATCLEKVDTFRMSPRGGDYFLQKRDALVHNLAWRCQQLAGKKVMTTYDELAAVFNQKLAGKFPFASVGANEEADVDVVRDFFKMFDQYGQASMETLKKSQQFGAARDSALEFLHQLEEVRAFFAPFLRTDEEAPEPKLQIPVYDFELDFRVNQEKEVGGNKIIDWEMLVGNQGFRYHGVTEKGRWNFGDPIRLSLRWAKDAPYFPASDGTQPDASVRGKRVVYEYTDAWSLIRVMRLHASSPADFRRYRDPRPHTLKFVVGTLWDPENPQAKMERIPITKVFIRLSIKPPGEKKPLLLPVFPKRAPKLVEDTIYSFELKDPGFVIHESDLQELQKSKQQPQQ